MGTGDGAWIQLSLDTVCHFSLGFDVVVCAGISLGWIRIGLVELRLVFITCLVCLLLGYALYLTERFIST